ncbi:MGH1-like glycoside hydrolase domain-containing protein, partial [Methylicorpusculum sp.]|uniref:MGH1-like glycoside hydrolase domain-containing protein n=1 Tax=Methylicorpusculum sp. TaxID=2713644 RepID=UPI002AB82E20|nr:glucosidase [Methylicorpusculum sp.]
MTAKSGTAEQQRLGGDTSNHNPWRLWGPYLSERQWGTVREDYSPQGEAWDYFSHDQARSRVYRWGEDGIGGVSDITQRLCLGVALWNGQDPILKERLFGLTNGEGNHGEDIKEQYYYLDAAPSHAYLKMLYKYPQRAFPYRTLVEENKQRGRQQPEFELLDTGIFEDDRYFDVFIEYAKADTDDILLRITAHNRGPEAAPLHILPQLWFRNTWSWGTGSLKPVLSTNGTGEIEIKHQTLGEYRCYMDAAPVLFFCDNDSNVKRLSGMAAPGYFKDAFHAAVIHRQTDTVNPAQTGTKACGHYAFSIPAHAKVEVRLRLSRSANTQAFNDFERIFATRIGETDAFYAALQSHAKDPDARMIQRQALAGMIWSKQFYYYDIPQWLHGDPAQPKPDPARQHGRNKNWQHLNNADIISMPDKWEYPWYASWDLAFHCVTLAMIDPAFAKHQILLMTRVWYMHPNGQIPAYEWSFDDVNPPVHAWAAWEIYKAEYEANGGVGDLDFLERV